MAQAHAGGESVDTIRLLGNHPVLDFVNTVDDRVSGERDVLLDYSSLVAWALRRGVVDETEAARLSALAAARPDDAARGFARAIALREHLYELFSAVASGATPSAADLAALQRSFVAAMRPAQLEGDSPGFRWSWPDAESFDRVAWGIAVHAMELLFSDQLGRLKMCPGHDCGWVFIDRSRNSSRRWCSMEGCGSKAKMRSLYRRRRRAASA